MDMTSSRLRWADLADRPRVLNEAHIRRVVEPLLRQTSVGDFSAGFNYGDLGDVLDRALVADLGVWVVGWRWNRGEGGPVDSSWDGKTDELCLEDDEEAAPIDATLVASWIVASVDEWHSFLETVERTFEELPTLGPEPRCADIERAAARILALVVERTQAEDAWYQAFHSVFDWYLEFRGLDPERYSAFVRATTAGKFASWTAPDEETSRLVCSKLGRTVAESPPPMPVDSLELWLGLRNREWSHCPEPNDRWPLPWDGHRRFIDRRDAQRSPERAARLHRALDAGRAWADSDEPLSLALLSQWQAIVMNRPPERLRTTDAFAKGGRERYGCHQLEPGLKACIAEAGELLRPLAVRATLAYLDVCFFHPYSDGNARLARVVLDALLWREGYLLYTVEPIFVLSRCADDSSGAWLLANVVATLMGKLPPGDSQKNES